MYVCIFPLLNNPSISYNTAHFGRFVPQSKVLRKLRFGVFIHFTRKMIRIPRGISPASGRGAVSGLSGSQQKTVPAMRTDFYNTGLASPQMHSVPAGYFTQIGNTTAAEQRPNCLYATPHGPEPKPVRTSSGRLPVSFFHPPRIHDPCSSYEDVYLLYHV